MLIYETSSDAEQDLEHIIDYTFEQYGINQTKKYINHLEQCAENLANGKGYFKTL